MLIKFHKTRFQQCLLKKTIFIGIIILVLSLIIGIFGEVGAIYYSFNSLETSQSTVTDAIKTATFLTNASNIIAIVGLLSGFILIIISLIKFNNKNKIR